MSNVREFWTLRVQNCASGPSARSRSLTLKINTVSATYLKNYLRSRYIEKIAHCAPAP